MDRKLFAIIVLGILLKIAFFPHTADDTFITFRYSENLVEGRGFVYNQGEQVLGITNPLYGIFIAAAMAVGIEPLIFSKLLGLISYLTILFLGWVFLSRQYDRRAAYAFALMVSVDYQISKWFMSGMETGLFSAMIFASVLLFLEDKEFLAGILAGTAFYFRPEAAFAFGILFIFSRRKRSMIPGALVLLSLFAVLQYFYKFPIPYSIYAKMALSKKSSKVLFESGYHIMNIVIKEPMPVFFLLFSPLSTLIPLMVPASVMVAYLVLRTPVFLWYYAPYYPLIFLASAVGISRFSKNLRRHAGGFVTLLLVFVAVHQVAFTAREIYLQSDNIQDIHIHKEFAENVSRSGGGIIVAEDIGALGYFSDAYILDHAGLVSPQIVECRVEKPFSECILQFEPDYIVARRDAPHMVEAAELLNCTDKVAESSLSNFYRC